MRLWAACLLCLLSPISDVRSASVSAALAKNKRCVPPVSLHFVSHCLCCLFGFGRLGQPARLAVCAGPPLFPRASGTPSSDH